MKTTLLSLAVILLLAGSVRAQAQDNAKTIKSFYAKADFALTADPNADAWKGIKGVWAERGPLGDLTPGHKTEIRTRWTDKNLYVLFVCAYEKLYLKPAPTTKTETNKLWEWDVAEVFLGTDFNDIKHYTEFQVSPQGEWVDLDIDRKPNPPNHNWEWNAAGFEVKARINEKAKIWYGEMRIPLAQVDARPAKAGNEMRVNFYRLQGPPPDRNYISWQPTGAKNYHVPEAFGRLRLEK